jgi:hypothetical protein
VRRANNLFTLMCRLSRNAGSLNLLEACNGIAFTYCTYNIKQNYASNNRIKERHRFFSYVTELCYLCSYVTAWKKNVLVT